jgi:hypothetical protein
MYEGQSVNMSQIDIKHKICNIRKLETKFLFLDIFTTNTDTLVLSLFFFFGL